MKCPRCEDQVLDEKDRDGVVVDLCRKCRGIWLDRGELEKLIARATVDIDENQLGSLARGGGDPTRRGGDDGHRGDDDSRPFGDERDRYGRRGERKRSWFEGFGDLFD
jgi:uncharacterized protein